MRPTALVLALASLPALAAPGWLDMGTFVQDGHVVTVFVEPTVSHTREAAVALARVHMDGKAIDTLMYVSAAECRNGHGTLHSSDNRGGPIRSVTTFDIGHDTVTDRLATHLCGPFDY